MTHRFFSSNPAIRLMDHLSISAADDAASLYLNALADKLVPVFGKGLRARKALARGFRRTLCIGAYDRDRLVGVLGIQTADAGFIRVTNGALRPFYGRCGSFWRAGLMAVLHHYPLAGEARIDGVVVAETYRCRGIGTDLIAAMEAWAAGRSMSMVTLEVVDTNPRAKQLYHRMGFQTVRAQTVWPYRSLLGWRSSAVMAKWLV